MKIFTGLFSRTPRLPRLNNLETQNDKNSDIEYNFCRFEYQCLTNIDQNSNRKMGMKESVWTLEQVKDWKFPSDNNLLLRLNYQVHYKTIYTNFILHSNPIILLNLLIKGLSKSADTLWNSNLGSCGGFKCSIF